MAIKPKFTKVWAETGVKEEVSESKISQGWVAERPPYQHENWSRNRQDQMLLHINEAGIAVWDEHTKYGQGGVSYVKGSDGVVYQSTQQSGGSFPVANPVTDRTRWKKAWVDSDGVITIPQVRDLQTELNKKVDKVAGKQLSTNDYTTTEKNKLGGIESGAQVNVPTNLTNTATTTTVSVNSSTGNNTTILNATSGRSGVMTSTDKVKLDNLPTGVGGIIPLRGGGTGATTAEGARDSLQLGSYSILDVPVDQIFTFDSPIPPKGFIERNGQTINPNTMPKLYARYGATMPDDRNRVHRMQGNLTGAVGSAQEDASQRALGSIFLRSFPSYNIVTGADGVFSNELTQQEQITAPTSSDSGKTSLIRFDTQNSVRTAGETRVKSRIVIFCNKIQ